MKFRFIEEMLFYIFQYDALKEFLAEYPCVNIVVVVYSMVGYVGLYHFL